MGGTQTITQVKEPVLMQFNILVVFLLIMATLLAVVGALGLTGTMSINVLERIREIGVMRAIGASTGAIMTTGYRGRHLNRCDQLGAWRGVLHPFE